MRQFFCKATLISGALFLAACQTVETGSPEATANADDAAKSENITPNQQVVNDIPDWCLNLPASETALYRCGIGESSSLNMARNRATLDAKRALRIQSTVKSPQGWKTFSMPLELVTMSKSGNEVKS